DLDLRQACPKTRVTPVPLLRAVLPDPDLVAENVPDNASRHGYSLRREIGLAVAAEEENAGMERLALRRLDPVHEYPFALLDAVLLAADGHDCVAHGIGMRTFVRARKGSERGRTRYSGGSAAVCVVAGLRRRRPPRDPRRVRFFGRAGASPSGLSAS